MRGAFRRASCADSQLVVNRRPRGSGPFFVGEVRLDVRVFEDEPGPEAAHVPVDETRSVVELDDRAFVGYRREAEAPRHPEVDEEARGRSRAVGAGTCHDARPQRRDRLRAPPRSRTGRRAASDAGRGSRPARACARRDAARAAPGSSRPPVAPAKLGDDVEQDPVVPVRRLVGDLVRREHRLGGT